MDAMSLKFFEAIWGEKSNWMENWIVKLQLTNIVQGQSYQWKVSYDIYCLLFGFQNLL